MLTRLILLVALLTSCQQGLIPCPVVESIPYKERAAQNPKLAMSKSKEEPEPRDNNWKKPRDKFTQNVSVEEWDCPRPGKKKYMPRSVKQNIRKNWKKINTPDSVHTARNK